MERLTYRDKKGEAHLHCYQMCADAHEDCNTAYEVDRCQRYVAFRKLADYEDAEEQGLLLRLPCKVGDTVYVPTRNFVSELRIILISIERDNIFFHWRLNTGIYPNLDGFTSSYIGKMVFFTCEEAEAKLKEMEGSYGE